MNQPIEYHRLDTRTQEQIQDNHIALNLIQSILEQQITSYALENPMNLYDEDQQEIVRKVEFSRGLKNHQIIYGPDGTILATSNEFPGTLHKKINGILKKLAFIHPNQSEEPYSP